MNLHYVSSTGLMANVGVDQAHGAVLRFAFPQRGQSYQSKRIPGRRPENFPISIPGWKGCRHFNLKGNFYQVAYDQNGRTVNSFDDNGTGVTFTPLYISGSRCVGYLDVSSENPKYKSPYTPFGTYITHSGWTWSVKGLPPYRAYPGGTSPYGTDTGQYYRTVEEVTQLLGQYHLLDEKAPTWPFGNVGGTYVQPIHADPINIRNIRSYIHSLMDKCVDIPSLLTFDQRNEILDECMQSFSRLATMRLACEVACDGLVLQAVQQLTSTISKFLSGTLDEVKFIVKNGRLMQQQLSVAKGLAQGYMTYNWGIRAPLGDYGNLLQILFDQGARSNFNNPFMVGRTSFNNIGPYQRVDVVAGCEVNLMRMDTIASTLFFLHKYGYTMTAGDIWEIIPLSFAVDWLIDISDWLSSLERKFNYENFPIVGSWLTTKGYIPFSLPGFIGSGTVTLYTRDNMPHSFFPSRTEYIPQFSLVGRLSISNLDDLLALGTAFFSP